MYLSKQNAQEIAEKMSKTLDGEVLTITSDFRIDYRKDKDGLNADGWIGEIKDQELPVKVTDIQLMWSTGHHSYSIPYVDNAQVEFINDNIVAILQRAASGERIFWTFIRLDRNSG